MGPSTPEVKRAIHTGPNTELIEISADPALQGKRREKQCLPLKASSNICSKCHPDDLLQSTFFNCFPEMFSFNVILALTPSLLFFFFLYLWGESEKGSWSPDYHVRPPWGLPRGAPPPRGRTSLTRYPLRGMRNDGANVCTHTSKNCLYASKLGSKVEPKS